MAEMIIQNPSITPNVFEYDEAGRVSAISGYPLAGGGGGTIVKSDLMWKPSVESDGYVHWTLASSATSPEAAYISGAQGPAGPQGEQGPSGTKGDTGEKGDKGDDATPITATTATIAGGTQVTISYTSGGDPLAQFNILSGAQGASGTNGKDGISPTVSTETITGGSRVIFTYDDDGTTKTESIDVMSGVSGANGSDGFSPTVVTAAIPVSEQFPAGGTEVTITDSDGQHIFNISNGLDGQGATVNLLGGEGIEVTKVASNYTISVSADYATKAYVEAASANAYNEAETWVKDQGYLTSVPPEYALTSDIPTAVAQLTDSGNYYQKTETSGATEITNALSTKLDSTAADQTYQTKSDMANYLTTSDASTTYQPKGDYATKTYVNEASANALSQAETWVGQRGFITKDADDLTYYYKKTETSGAAELATEFAKYVIKPDSSLVNNYLVLRTDNAGNVSGWCDFNDQCYSKAESDRTFVATANIDTTTLSGNGKSVSTKLGVKTDVIPTKDWLDDNYLPLSGGTVSGNVIVKSTGKNILAVNTTATLMGQSRVNSLTDTTAIGTNWLGVNSYGGGFLKNVQGGNVGDLNGTSLQINFAPDGANSYGNITVESQGNQSKVVHVPTTSYNSMSSFDPTNGPNYMLRKTASGFDIGACVINVTEVPTVTEANTYYFVYDIV